MVMIQSNTLAERKQRLEEAVDTARAALEREEKLRKELEALNTKLLSEKSGLLSSLDREKNELSSIAERTAKLQAQKNDLDLQLQVSLSFFLFTSSFSSIFKKKIIIGKKAREKSPIPSLSFPVSKVPFMKIPRCF